MIYSTFIINLPSRPDRLIYAREVINKYGFNYTVIEACEGGAEGIKRTLQTLFKVLLQNETINHVLIFEDDVRFETDPLSFRTYFESALVELPSDYDILTLGANIEKPEWCSRYSESLYKLSTFKALHAVMYSRSGMSRILKIDKTPIDEHVNGNIFITYPLLCTQQPGVSDIRGKRVTYDFMGDRYEAALNYANEKYI